MIHRTLSKDKKKSWQTSRLAAPIESFAIFTAARAALVNYLDPDRSIVNRINSVHNGETIERCLRSWFQRDS